MYSMASGVAQDNVQAYMWYDLAASHGDELCAKFRDEVALKMTSGQIVQAKALVAAWKPTTEQ
jgi:TPR repeat protein